ncbi:MAG: PorV/PorQ family protein [bacterium]
MIKKVTTISLIWLLCLCVPGAAGTDRSAGTTASAFLNIGQGGRASGMGGAFVSVADDPTAPYWNPAGISQITGRSLGFAHTLWLEDISATYLGYVQPLGDKAGLGLGLIGLSSGDMEKWAEDGSSEGSFGAFDGAIILSYARKIFPGLSLGAGLKLIHEGIDNKSEKHFALDAGGVYHLPRHPIKLGLVIQNLGPKASLVEEDFSLPLTIKLGGSYSLLAHRLIMAADMHKIKGQRAGFNLGLEYWAIPSLALRAGYNLKGESTEIESLSGLSVGLGFRIKNYGLDYAYSAGDKLDGVHKVSFGLDLRAKPKKAEKIEPELPKVKPEVSKPKREERKPKPKREIIEPKIVAPKPKPEAAPEPEIKREPEPIIDRWEVEYKYIKPKEGRREVEYEYIEPERYKESEKLIPEERQAPKAED